MIEVRSNASQDIVGEQNGLKVIILSVMYTHT